MPGQAGRQAAGHSSAILRIKAVRGYGGELLVQVQPRLPRQGSASHTSLAFTQVRVGAQDPQIGL